ncbi:hypothetical protein HT102_10330 [Hoyosella sp. G463]|uniref:DUF916 domain-containing protein n=1 Tax=Lolliginicoccus lacisalsi TaxID=2742202 RepID=A0A927PL98_9ACTN|nr:hypothetical protein [Lolliginicoccus lacisalsi]MBD8506885.1 hypothetical protein [Lolliginicoccus lacisalsi]
MRRLLPLVIAAALLAPVSAVHAQPAPEPGPIDDPGLGIRLMEVPLHLQDDPRAQVYVIDNIEAGDSFDRRLEISNRTGTTQDVDLYVGAADVDAQDGFKVADGAGANELTEWTELDTSEVTLEDRENAEIVLSVDVPEGTEDGERYGVVWAEMTSGEPDEGGAVVVNRVGVRIYLAIGDSDALPADFAITGMTPRRTAEGVAELVVDIDNTGGRAVDITGSLDLTEGPGGIRLDTVRSNQVTVPAGEPGQAVFALSETLPNGPWQANVTLASGLLERTTSAQVTFPDTGVGDSVGAEQETQRTWWWILLAIAVLALLAAIIIIRQRSRNP